MESPIHGIWFVVVTILAAFMLAITPIDGVMAWARPDWPLLICAYWLLALSDRFGIVSCWVIGLMQDILQSAVLGQNAFALVVIAYIFQVSYQRLRMFGVQRQAALLALLELFRILVDQWAQNINGVTETHWLIFLPVVTTSLTWLVLRPVLQRMQYVFGVD